MAPAPSPLTVPASNSSSDHLRSFHRRILSFSRHTLAQPSVMRRGHTQPRAPDTALQPSFVPGGPSQLPPSLPTSTTPPVVSEQPGPTPTDAPYINSQPQPQSTNQPGDVPGNIVAGIMVAVLILGGLLGLVLGGEILRRRAKPMQGERSGMGCFRRKKSKAAKRASENLTSSSPDRSKASPEKFSYDEKTLTPPLTRPSTAVSRERRGRLSGVWPIRSLSQVLRSHRRVAKGAPPGRQQIPPVASPQTTWSEFTPARLYAAPPRTFLPGIPEEGEEDRRSQTESDFAIMLGVALKRSYSGSVQSNPHTSRPESPNIMKGRESTETGMQHAPRDRQMVCNDDATNEEENKSLESSAPGMTSDGEESSRSSVVSLDESLGGEVFELRRAQTRSMQMNKGVLLSLGMKTLEGNRRVGAPHGERGCTGSSRVSTFELDAEVSKEYADSGLTIEMLGASFSAINLDEFPSPPSRLPMIPSFVSSF